KSAAGKRSRPLKTLRRSALLQLFKFRNESRWAAWDVTRLADQLAIRIQHYDGGITFNIVFLAQGFVRSFLRSAQLFETWKVHLDKRQILLGIFGKLRFREDFLVQLDAPAAPI